MIMNKLPFFELSLNQETKYCIGLSGGVDSVVLLHIIYSIGQLKQIPLEQIQAIHVNHGISKFADEWQSFCEEYCQKLGIKLTVFNFVVQKNKGQGLENSARKARYKAFAEMKNVDLLVLAHHIDDQYETMLTQIMRGSDLHNVAAMNEYRDFADKKIWRPLLDFSKSEILDYANQNQLQYIEDDSNIDNSYLRNFLRNNIIPQLKDYDSNLYNKFEAYLSSIKTHVVLADELAQEDLARCQIQNYKKLSCDLLKDLSPSRQLNLIAYFMQKNCEVITSHKSIKEFIRQCAEVNYNLHGATPIIEIGSIRMICKHRQIYFE